MKLEPFRALCPPAARAHSVASPPYDVVSETEAREAVQKEGDSFLTVIRPEVGFSVGEARQGLSTDSLVEKAHEELLRLVREGALEERKPAYYIYRLRQGDHAQIGLVAAASVDEYVAGTIKKHELTRPDKEDDRTRHIDGLSAQTGLVFLVHRGPSELDAAIASLLGPHADEEDFDLEPYVKFERGDVEHTVWAVDEPDAINTLREAASHLDELYIADGHHRAAAASRVRDLRRERAGSADPEAAHERFVVATFSHDAVQVLPYNRVIKDLRSTADGPERTPEAFLDAIAESFLVRPATVVRPTEPRRYCLYVGGKWYELEPHTEPHIAETPVEALDVSILQNQLLEPVLGISDPRRDARIGFVGGSKGPAILERMVDRGHYAAAFSLYPTRLEEVMTIADASSEMPPKSTWFEPKLLSGLFVHPLDDSFRG